MLGVEIPTKGKNPNKCPLNDFGGYVRFIGLLGHGQPDENRGRSGNSEKIVKSDENQGRFSEKIFSKFADFQTQHRGVSNMGIKNFWEVRFRFSVGKLHGKSSETRHSLDGKRALKIWKSRRKKGIINPLNFERIILTETGRKVH